MELKNPLVTQLFFATYSKHRNPSSQLQ